MNKKTLPVLLIILFAISCFPLIVYAASGTIDTDGTYDIGAFGNDSIITIDSLASTDGLTVTLTNTSGTTYTNLRINCVDAGTKLTINGVLIDNSATSGACALAFSGAGNTLTLVGDSSLVSGNYEPGIKVEDGTALEISGSGTLNATGGSQGAGIGSRRYFNGGAVTILSGTITASGGNGGAGIGGGYREFVSIVGYTINTQNGNGGEVTIKGGTVVASGGAEAAGIGGGGMGGEGGITTIEGGSVTASGNGGAGIGGGGCIAYVASNDSVYYVILAGSGDGGTTTISGGDVSASSKREGGVISPGAGIGGGFAGYGGIVTISGGVVTASSSSAGGVTFGSAGIGGGAWNDGGVTTIEGGIVTANGSVGGAGIGGGNKLYLSGYELIGGGSGAGGTITIEDGTVVAAGGESGAGIGGGGVPTGGTGGSGGTIAISGGVVYAEGDVSHSAYDIGPGSFGTEGALTISGLAAVFLGGDACLPPTLPVPHSHKTPTDAVEPMIVCDGTIYGIAGTGVSPWTTATGGYFVLYSIVYDANGGKGIVSNTAQIPGSTAAVKPSNGIWQPDYVFVYWNTLADDTGTRYYPGNPLTLTSPSITLYAQWILAPPTGDPAGKYLVLFSALALLSLTGIIILLYTRAKQRSR